MDMSIFLTERPHIDFLSPLIQDQATALFRGLTHDTAKAEAAFLFVRDEITHSFDGDAKVITAKASDVLRHKTGICHAKANLLAALLRQQEVPAGFCFQRTTLADDDALGYVVHAFNAVFVAQRWIYLDARGNKPGVDARFSLGEPVPAFAPRAEYDEYIYPGIYAEPHAESMRVLDEAKTLQEVLDNLPDKITAPPALHIQP